jgi:O-antigen/teichoic acid export membrane protein
MIYAALASREYPDLRLNLRNCDAEHLRLIFSFSVYAFLITISIKLVFYTDSIVIGYALPVSMITFFAIAGNLASYSRDLLSGISTTVAPRASAMDATSDEEGVRRVIAKGVQFGAMVMLPIAVTFIIRGKTFIRLWMGYGYSSLSGHVLWVLALSLLLLPTEAVAGSAMMGISKHKLLAKILLLEAFCNLGLSLLLVHRWGIVGVAWGTTIPSLTMNLLFWPWYLKRVLGVSPLRFAASAWLRPALGVVPFTALTYLIERTWGVTHLGAFFLQVGVILPVAALGYWSLSLSHTEREEYARRLARPFSGVFS